MGKPRQHLERVSDGDHPPLIGSDIRGVHRGACRLCESEADLLLGHVVPKWMGRWARSEGLLVGDYRSLGVETETQDLTKHYLLCAACEQRLGDAENYLSVIVRGEAAALTANGVVVRPGDGAAMVIGADDRRLKRALCGILLKAAAAPSTRYRNISLSRYELRELRTAIATDDYPENRIALLGVKWLNTSVPEANPRAVVVTLAERLEGGLRFELFAAGMSWYLFLGPAQRLRDRIDPDPELQKVGFLHPGIPWGVVVQDWSHHPWLRMPPQALASVAETDPCPCGLGPNFGACCAGVWVRAAAAA